MSSSTTAPLPPRGPPTTATAAMPGRVVRLQFECRAAIPIGSFLRVTGSSLWAPGTAASDPAEAAPAVGRTEESAFPVTEGSSSALSQAGLYTSSIEMVTTPDTYPVWRTRKPVVVVLNRHAALKQRVQYHYYRYLVVSPVGAQALAEDNNNVTVSTSSEFMGTTAVMQWEDPYGTLDEPSDTHAEKTSFASGLSLTSCVDLPALTHTRADYRNLPYRTLDIDVAADRQIITQDNWNVADDASFQPYLIREAVRRIFNVCGFISCIVSTRTQKISHIAFVGWLLGHTDSRRKSPQDATSRTERCDNRRHGNGRCCCCDASTSSQQAFCVRRSDAPGL
jgi:hypothetical protein